jgi:hypothetical protein
MEAVLFRSSRWFLPLAAGVLVALAAPMLVEWVQIAGLRIPQQDLGRDYLVGIVWALALTGVLLLVPLRSPDKPALLALWLVKCAVTLGFMLFYEQRYGIDAYGYFAVARESSFDWSTARLGQGTQIIGGLSWVHARIIPDSFHSLKVSFALVGLVAVYLFYRAAVRFRGREDVRLLYLLALFPSVMFWSSIYGKDPVVLFGIALYAYGVVGWHRTRRWGFVAAIAAGVLVAMAIRLWMGPVLILPLVLFALRGLRGFVPRAAFAGAALGGLGLALAAFARKFGIASAEDVLATTNLVSQAWAEGGSGQQISGGFSSFGAMAAFVPRGAFTALFRPLPGEIMNPFGLLAGLENLLLLGLAAVAAVRFRLSVLRDPIVAWALAVVATWSVLYAFISYQNLGAAVRFKLQVLPILLLLLLYLAFDRRTASDTAPRTT